MSLLARRLINNDGPVPTVWQWVGQSAATTVASGDVTMTEPSGVQQGDLLVAVISYRSNVAFTSPGSPWVLVEERNTGNTTVNGTGSIASGVMYYCIRGASAPGLVFTRTGGDVAMGYIEAYRGVDTASPFVASTSTTLAAASASVNVTGLTTANSNDLVVFFLASARAGGTTAFNAATDPNTSSGVNSSQTANPITGTWQERMDGQTTTGADAARAYADAVKGTAGATGNLSCTAGTSARHVVIAAAFKKAA